MAKSFESLAARAKSGWSAETEAVYDAASRTFQAETSLQLLLGEQLAQARRKRRITQPELAGLTGINQSEISRIENGHANPTIATVSRMLAALDYTAELNPRS